MGRIGRRIVQLWFVGLFLGSLGAAFAALLMKRRIVPKDDSLGDEVALAAFFGPLAFRSTARSFRGGTLDCWFGGGVIDLRSATLDPAGTRLRIRTVFGGAQLIVPESWRITVKVIPIFGGVGDGRPRIERPADGPHLTIEGVTVFGGVGVVSELPSGGDRWRRQMQAS